MAARIISQAAFLSGFEVQDFAIYGAERRGAPVSAFVRIDREPIFLRGYVESPDCIIVLDDTLFGVSHATSGARQDTAIIINTREHAGKIREELGVPSRVFCVDATRVAMKLMGKNIPNVAMCGPFAKISGAFSMRTLEQAIRLEMEGFPKKAVDANIRAARECAEKSGGGLSLVCAGERRRERS